MQHSEEINELAKALAAAQGEIKNAVKDQANPFFKSKYADLAGIVDACKIPLSQNGIAVIQGTHTSLNAQGEPISVVVQLETMIVHSSGQWISSIITMTPNKFDPQGIGSCLTYARRYALASMVGVAPEDDDGNGATGKPKPADATPDDVKLSKTPYPELEAELVELTKHPLYTEEQRQMVKEFIAASPNYDALLSKVKQVRWYVENKPAIDARENVKEEKLKKAKKKEPEQRELTEAEQSALDAQLVQ